MQKRPRLLERVELPCNPAQYRLCWPSSSQPSRPKKASAATFIHPIFGARGSNPALFTLDKPLSYARIFGRFISPIAPASSFHAFFTDKNLDSPAITSQIDPSQWPSLCVRRSLAPRSRSPQGRRKERESGTARGAKEADQFHQVLGPPACGHGSVWSCLVSLSLPSIFGCVFEAILANCDFPLPRQIALRETSSPTRMSPSRRS